MFRFTANPKTPVPLRLRGELFHSSLARPELVEGLLAVQHTNQLVVDQAIRG